MKPPISAAEEMGGFLRFVPTNALLNIPKIYDLTVYSLNKSRSSLHTLIVTVVPSLSV